MCALVRVDLDESGAHPVGNRTLTDRKVPHLHPDHFSQHDLHSVDPYVVTGVRKQAVLHEFRNHISDDEYLRALSALI